MWKNLRTEKAAVVERRHSRRFREQEPGGGKCARPHRREGERRTRDVPWRSTGVFIAESRVTPLTCEGGASAAAMKNDM